MNNPYVVSAYKDVGLETSVMSADPHQLVSLLFQGALMAIAQARIAMQAKQTDVKGRAITKAIAIIGEGLHASLDMKAGGDLAQNLAALYSYMVRKLVEANLKNDTDALDEVKRLLTELQSAWDSIRPQVVQAAAA